MLVKDKATESSIKGDIIEMHRKIFVFSYLLGKYNVNIQILPKGGIIRDDGMDNTIQMTGDRGRID